MRFRVVQFGLALLGASVSLQAFAEPRLAAGSSSPPRAMEPFRVKQRMELCPPNGPPPSWWRAWKSAQRTKRAHVLKFNFTREVTLLGTETKAAVRAEWDVQSNHGGDHDWRLKAAARWAQMHADSEARVVR